MRLIAALLIALPLAVAAAEPAAAQSCDSVYPGATFDPQRNSCLARRVSESACRQMPGAIQWHKDRGAGADVCEFRVLSEPSPGRPGSASGGANRGGGQNPSPDNPFASRPGDASGRSGSVSPDNPFARGQSGGGGICRAYFAEMSQQFLQLARQCASSANSMTAMNDFLTVQGTQSGIDQGEIRRGEARGLFLVVRPDDPGWVIAGEVIYPECRQSLSVERQSSAFTECVRVYLCGRRAVRCAESSAAFTQDANCAQHSQRCLIANPVPQAIETRSGGPASRPAPSEPQAQGKDRSNSGVSTSGSGSRPGPSSSGSAR